MLCFTQQEWNSWEGWIQCPSLSQGKQVILTNGSQHGAVFSPSSQRHLALSGHIPGIHGLSQLGNWLISYKEDSPYSKAPSFPNIGSAKPRHYYSSLDSLVQQECRRNISLMESWGSRGHVHCLLCLDFLSPFGHFSFPLAQLTISTSHFLQRMVLELWEPLIGSESDRAWECPSPKDSPELGWEIQLSCLTLERDLKFTVWSTHRIWLRMGPSFLGTF